jgi:hypothetical protein
MQEKEIDLNLSPTSRIPLNGKIKYLIVSEDTLKMMSLDSEDENDKISREAKALLISSSAILVGYLEGIRVFLDPMSVGPHYMVCWTREA